MASASAPFKRVLCGTWHAILAVVAMAALGCSGCDKNSAAPCFCVAFSPDGRLLAAGRGTYLTPGHNRQVGYGDLVVWPTESWAAPSVLQNDLSGRVMGVAFHDGGRDVMGASDAHVKVQGT